MYKIIATKSYSIFKQNIKSICWATIILILSLFHVNTPGSIKEYIIPHSDKLVHIFLYAVFSFLLLIESKKSKRNYIRLLFAIFYGIFMELFQHFLTIHRSLELLDIFANFSGVLFGLFLYSKFKTNNGNS